MKRLVIALTILAVLVGANIYTHSLLDRTGMEMMEQIEQLENLVNQNEADQLVQQCVALQKKWLETEGLWSHFMRSDRLEAITIAAARLPALAQHGQTADVAAELCELRIMLGEVLSFESPSFSDIL